MTKKDIRTALKGSMKQEEKSIQKRFETAESLFAQTPKQSAKAFEATHTEKVIRDSFTMPILDHALIGKIKQRSIKAGIVTTKSEVVRAGLIALTEMTEARFIDTVKAVTKVKVGRQKIAI